MPPLVSIHGFSNHQLRDDVDPVSRPSDALESDGASSLPSTTTACSEIGNAFKRFTENNAIRSTKPVETEAWVFFGCIIVLRSKLTGQDSNEASNAFLLLTFPENIHFAECSN